MTCLALAISIRGRVIVVSGADFTRAARVIKVIPSGNAANWNGHYQKAVPFQESVHGFTLVGFLSDWIAVSPRIVIYPTLVETFKSIGAPEGVDHGEQCSWNLKIGLGNHKSCQCA